MSVINYRKLVQDVLLGVAGRRQRAMKLVAKEIWTCHSDYYQNEVEFEIGTDFPINK